jgi:isocitrate dehydrogenase
MNYALTPITVAHGDGIGPEIMAAVLKILKAANARIQIETIEVGQKVYQSGISSGISESAWASIRRTKVLLKAPITTPQGGGYKSLNVSIRAALGLYANVRPCVAYAPFVKTNHPKMNLVIVRENEEDLYTGIEHRQTPHVVQCLKLISREGSERIIRYAFEYARQNNRKKVTCMTKDNIMKMADGLFHQVFDQVAKEYPDIATEHMIIDIGAARIADRPEHFDVVVTLNLYGDIISDIAAEVAGSVGLAGSANIGRTCAMFEAIHGSAPDIAGQDKANPSGLLQGAIQMLVHINQPDVAETIHNAWLRTLELGYHTGDIYTPEHSKELLGTQAFAEAVIRHLGQQPQTFTPVHYQSKNTDAKHVTGEEVLNPLRIDRRLVGVDVFLYHASCSPDALGEGLKSTDTEMLSLKLITNRSVKVWPEGFEETVCGDHWRCRFLKPENLADIRPEAILELLAKIQKAGFETIKTENLYTYDGVKGYSMAQGE